jgi:hypothetical protein
LEGGGGLYLAVERALYWYGDPRTLFAMPKRVMDNLIEPPMPLTGGLVAVHMRNADGTIADKIVRLRGAAFDVVWSVPGSESTTFGYDPKAAPDVLTIGSTDGADSYGRFLRTDGMQLLVKDPCQMVGSDRQLLVTLCRTRTLVGNRYLQYLAAYRWPKR